MAKRDTRADWARRIGKVVEHIGDHLDDDLSVDRLAEISCFSRFHFHRIYTAIMGMTVAETVAQFRLYRASGELVSSDRPIGEVARRAGYGSQAAFTRAYRGHFGTTPGTVRIRSREKRIARTMTTTQHALDVRTIEPIRCAAIPHVGPFSEIGTKFGRLLAWAAGAGIDPRSARSFAVYYDDGMSGSPDQHRSAACVEIGADVFLDGAPVEALVIEGGRHAVYRHVGPYDGLHEAYMTLYRELLPANGLVPADRPCFEQYLNDPSSTPAADLLTDIYVPVV